MVGRVEGLGGGYSAAMAATTASQSTESPGANAAQFEATTMPICSGVVSGWCGLAQRTHRIGARAELAVKATPKASLLGVPSVVTSQATKEAR